MPIHFDFPRFPVEPFLHGGGDGRKSEAERYHLIPFPLPGGEFGPRQVKSLRERLVESGNARTYVDVRARSGEVVILRACDLDMSGEVWVFTSAYHKAEHRGHARTTYLGPRAQQAAQPFLDGRSESECLFSPREAMEEHHRLRPRTRRAPGPERGARHRASRPRRRLKRSLPRKQPRSARGQPWSIPRSNAAA